MSDSEFPTTILTSKSPEEVANFLPHSLQLSSTLIEKHLSVWFANYAAMISRYNQDLNALVANGRNFFTGAGDEFGSLDKIWNCVASSVMSQIQVNESLIKVIRKDVLAQFNAAFKDDFKYSELLVNSEELLEMKAHMDDANGAYHWNVKAPAILGNFENYKRFEKELIFNAFISYLNAINTKTAGLVHKNENAVNFILKEYHIDNEMQLYTDYVIAAKAPAVASKAKPAPPPEPPLQRPQTKTRPSVASSVNSGSTAGTPVKEKRKSKLRSKVGSILGRKKKDTPLNHAETIPEDASAASVPSRSGTFVSRADTRHSVQNTGPARPAPGPRNEPQPVETRSAGLGIGGTNLNTPPPSSHNDESKQFAPPGQIDKSQGFPPTFDAQPLEPSQVSRHDISPVKEISSPSKATEIPQSASVPKPIHFPESATIQDLAESHKPTNVPEINRTVENSLPGKFAGDTTADEEANFVKYSSSDDESDDQADNLGNRLSLLNTHNLDQPPKVDHESDNRSRNTSNGKYSFEYGDEAKSISTPNHTPVVASAPQLEQFGNHAAPVTPEKPIVEEKPELSSVATPVQAKNPPHSPAAVRAPPPPPSRKAHPAPQEVQRELHSNRDSFIQPHAGDRMSLVSQTTGNSLLRQDHFKHFGASEEPIREGLNTSIAEIINATFKDGRITKAQVLGEIAFNYNSTKPMDSLTINIPTKFSKFLLNDSLMSKHDSEKYTLKLAPITGKTLGGIKYSLDSSFDHVPVLVKQIWKFEPKQASLIIKLSLNPVYSKSVRLENFTISASLDPSVSSISASSKPEGSFNKDVNRITWRYVEPLEFSATSPEVKLIARIMTTDLAKESASGIRLRFTISEGAASKVKILDSAHQPVASISSLSSGNYSSHI